MDEYRTDDDGEPRGTAGPPILRQIDSFGLTDIIVVVTRYFGGTKLGTGGLIRAYGSAARLVLTDASIEESVRSVSVGLTFAYEHTAAVNSVLSRFNAVTVKSAYGESTNLTVSLPAQMQGDFVKEIEDATSGQIAIILQN